MKLRILNACASWSGNTLEVSDLIDSVLKENGFEVVNYHIGLGFIPNPDDFDIMFLGSFTWDKGSTPDEVKDFVADLGVKPPNVYVYGTGDTQFGGDDLFCLAARKLSKFYNSRKEALLIEQSPRGTQESRVITWVNDVILNYIKYGEYKNLVNINSMDKEYVNSNKLEKEVI